MTLACSLLSPSIPGVIIDLALVSSAFRALNLTLALRR